MRNFLSQNPIIRRGLALLIFLGMVVVFVVVVSQEQKFRDEKKTTQRKDKEATGPQDFDVKEEAEAAKRSCEMAKRKAEGDDATTHDPVNFLAAQELQTHANSLFADSRFEDSIPIFARAEALYKSASDARLNQATLAAAKADFERARDAIGQEVLRMHGQDLWLDIQASIDRHVHNPAQQVFAYRDATKKLREYFPQIQLRLAKALIDDDNFVEGVPRVISLATNPEAKNLARDILLRMSERDPTSWLQVAFAEAEQVPQRQDRIWAFLGYAMADQNRTDDQYRCFQKASQFASFVGASDNGFTANYDLAVLRYAAGDSNWHESLQIALEFGKVVSNRLVRRRILTEIAGTATAGGDQALASEALAPVLDAPKHTQGDYYKDRMLAHAMAAAGRVDEVRQISTKLTNGGYDNELPMVTLTRATLQAAKVGDEANYERLSLHTLPFFLGRRRRWSDDVEMSRHYAAMADAYAGKYERATITGFSFDGDERDDVLSVLASSLAKNRRYKEATNVLAFLDEHSDFYGLNALKAVYDVASYSWGIGDPFIFELLTDESSTREQRIAVMVAMADRFGPGKSDSRPPRAKPTMVPPWEEVDINRLTPSDWLQRALLELRIEPPREATAMVAVMALEAATNIRANRHRSQAADMAWDGIVHQFQRNAAERPDKLRATRRKRQSHEAADLIELMLQIADSHIDAGDRMAASEAILTAIRTVSTLEPKWDGDRYTRQDVLCWCAARAQRIGDRQIVQACRNAASPRYSNLFFDTIVAIENGHLDQLELAMIFHKDFTTTFVTRPVLGRFWADLAIRAAQQGNQPVYRQASALATKSHYTSKETLALADLAAGHPNYGLDRIRQSSDRSSQDIRAQIVVQLATRDFSKAVENATSDVLNHLVPRIIAARALARAFAKSNKTSRKCREYLSTAESPLERVSMMIGFAEAG